MQKKRYNKILSLGISLTLLFFVSPQLQAQEDYDCSDTPQGIKMDHSLPEEEANRRFNEKMLEWGLTPLILGTSTSVLWNAGQFQHISPSALEALKDADKLVREVDAIIGGGAGNIKGRPDAIQKYAEAIGAASAIFHKKHSIRNDKHFTQLEYSQEEIKKLEKNKDDSRPYYRELYGTAIKVFTLSPREMKQRGLKVYKAPKYTILGKDCLPRFRKILGRTLDEKRSATTSELNRFFSKGDCKLSFTKHLAVPIRATPSKETDWKDYTYIQTDRPVLGLKYKDFETHPSDMTAPWLDIKSFVLHGTGPGSAYTKEERKKILKNAKEFLNGQFKRCVLDDFETNFKYQPLKDFVADPSL